MPKKIKQFITIALLFLCPPLYAEPLFIPFTLNETAGITSTNLPITFAQPLVKGDVTSNQTLKVLASDSRALRPHRLIKSLFTRMAP